MSGIPVSIRLGTSLVLLSTGLFIGVGIKDKKEKLDLKYPKVVKPAARDGDFPDVWERKY